MSNQDHYFVYIDFWITREKIKQILPAIEDTIPNILRGLAVEAELFIYVAGRNEIAVPILLFMLDTEPTESLISSIKTNVHNVLVDKSDVYEEGEVVIMKFDHKLLPYQFMELNNYNQALTH